VVGSGDGWWSTPSGNIACSGAPDDVRCDVLEYTYTPVERPLDCPLDWGHAVYMGDMERGFLCASDTVIGAPEILGYGEAWDFGGIRCTSTQLGVRCENGEGRGFLLARDRYELF
jgi:hypothetical protein